MRNLRQVYETELRNQHRSYDSKPRKIMKKGSKFFMILLALVLSFQQLNVVSLLGLMNGKAQGHLLTVEAGPIYEGDEVILTLTRSSEESETIEFTLPEGIALDVGPTEINFSDETEFTYDEATHHVKVSYGEGEQDKEVKLYIYCEEAGTYWMPVTSTNGTSEELEIRVNEVEVEGVDENPEQMVETEEQEASGDQMVEIEEQKTNDDSVVETDEQETSDGPTLETDEQEDVSEDSTLETEEQKASSKADGTVEVYDEATFIAALQDKTVTVINITADFAMITNNGNAQPTYTSYIRPELEINGNGHTVDFRGFCPNFIVTANNPMNLTIRNIIIYGKNYYGPIVFSGTSGYGKIRYEDVTYYGAQITASYTADLTFAGDIVCEQMLSYISPIDGSTQSTQANLQANFEATNLIIEAGATYTGTTVNSGAWFLYYGGSAIINEGAVVNLYAPDIVGEIGSTIYVQGDLIIKDGAELNIYNTTNGTSAYARPALNVGNNSNVYVGSGAKLNIDIDGYLYGQAAIYLGVNASFIVEDEAQLTMTLRNQGASPYAAIQSGGNATFVIGKKATFDVVSDGTGAKNLLYLAGSNNTFRFADAKRVNIQLDNTNASSRLIYTVGNLDIDVQKVSLWTEKNWTSGEDDNATYSWTPIYGLVATYYASNITSVTANSLSQEVTNEFLNTFKSSNSGTGSTRRMLFEYIPDVEVSLNELSDDTSKANSYTITGVANPGANVLLSGNEYIPAGTLPGQADSDEALYHAIADSEGKFSITLEEGHYFTAGEEITAYAFMNGKSDTDTTIVKDEVAPDKPVLDFITNGTVAFIGKAEANSIVTIYKDDLLIASGIADEDGNYEIMIPSEITLIEGDAYYSKATDAAGNESEPSDRVTVIMAKPFEEMSVENLNGKNGYSVGDRVRYTIVLKNLAEDTRTVWDHIDVKDTLPAGLEVDTDTFKEVYTNLNGDVTEYSFDGNEVWDSATNLLNITHDHIFGTEEIIITFEAIIGDELANCLVVNSLSVISDYFEEISDEVQFTVGGGLNFVSAPHTMDFGDELKISSQEKAYQLESIDEKLVVQDSRGSGNTWSLRATLLNELTSETGHELLGSLYYIVNNQEYAFSQGNSILIYDAITESSAPVEISNTWNNPEGETIGPVLKVRAGQAKSESYQGEIQWLLQDVPGNEA